jgi:type II secretory pathway component PulF
MAFRLGLKMMANFSDQLGTMLEAGLPISKALHVLGRNARPGVRGLARRLGSSVEQGDSLAQALEREGRRFPVLYRRLVLVGEETGGLPAVLKQLATYYRYVRDLWVKFWGNMVYPAFNYLALIAVLSIMAYFAEAAIGQTFIAGLAPGEIFFGGLALPVAGFLLYMLITRLLGGRYLVHQVLMCIPVVASIMRAMALGRFAWCMQLMTDAGVNIIDAVRWSLEATGNQVYVAKAPRVIGDIRGGAPLTEALRKTHLFPYDFMQLLETGEESGEMPSMLGKLAEAYQSKTGDALKALATASAVVIWAIVAGIIIYFIFMIWGHVLRGRADVLGG